MLCISVPDDILARKENVTSVTAGVYFCSVSFFATLTEGKMCYCLDSSVLLPANGDSFLSQGRHVVSYDVKCKNVILMVLTEHLIFCRSNVFFSKET